MAALSALGVFSRAEQRVLQAIFKAIEDGDGCCVATLATLARSSNTSKTTTRNAITRAVAIGMLEETDARFLRIWQAGRRRRRGSRVREEQLAIFCPAAGRTRCELRRIEEPTL